MCVCLFTKHLCTQDHALKASTRYGASTDADRRKPFLKSHWRGGVASPHYGTSVNDWWRIKPRLSTQGTCKHCRAQPKCRLCRIVFWMEDTEAQVTSWNLMSQYKLLFCFTQNSYLPFEWGFIHLSSPVLLGEASCSLHFGESRGVALCPQCPCVAPGAGTSPCTAWVWGNTNCWSLMHSPRPSHIFRRPPKAERLPRFPEEREQRQQTVQQDRLLTQPAFAGQAPNGLGACAKQPCFPDFLWATPNESLKYNTS